MTDEEFNAIYERLTGFHWEPRWHCTGKCLVQRKGKTVTVRRQDVKGQWTYQGGAETYAGEDYGNEVVVEPAALTEYLQLIDRYYDALPLPQIETNGYPREEALWPINQRMNQLYPDDDLPESIEARVREHQNKHYQRLVQSLPLIREAYLWLP